MGLAFALVNLWKIAPGPSQLARDQAVVAASGSNLSLVSALRTLPTAGA